MNKQYFSQAYRIDTQEYEVEKLDPRTKRWVKIGKVSGDKRPLTFDVTGLEEGQMYDFRVTAINAEGESEALTTDCAIKAKNPFGRPGMPQCMHGNLATLLDSVTSSVELCKIAAAAWTIASVIL